MSLYTIFGGKGFIGSEFVKQLIELKHEVFIPEKNDSTIFSKNLGIVIYAAGYGDCKSDPYNVLEANTVLLSRLLNYAQFKKIIYLSSTRLYMNQDMSFENNDISVFNDDNRRLFNLTKLTSEELCLKSNKDCLIIRPSNVYGLALNSSLFLPTIIKGAIENGFIDMYVSKNYKKDYVSVYDLVSYTIKLIKLNLSHKVINIASGINTSALEIASILENETSCTVNWHPVKPNVENFPITDISTIKSILNYTPSYVLDDLASMIQNYKLHLGNRK
ncbi:SDR family oxidoreductase [Proteus vulgaris]|uniref:SDR family oxidoreductase n=1 Tax=Proteus mirabilis TaxID=584 RepID=UPI0013743A97|nr:SDR family oxidoreductase [Proteus mirabilis]MDC5973695.1 SDR family oxidoreductase [Proteus mirabilis]QHP75100.1 SDR family oxidoreductase [Proteus vulgaris]